MDQIFSTVNWSKGSAIYEVNLRQYTNEGTFSAFGKQLARLKDMGITILWFMPVTPISYKARQGTLGSYYACSSYTEVNPEFGSLADFKKLVSNAHALGLKVIIDWVANHTGPDHHWTTEHPEWYVKDKDGNFTEKNGWKDVIDLDFSNEDMRRAMIEAMQFWVRECNVDGFRCDMAHLVPLDFWREARIKCESIRPLFWLAECEVVEYHAVFDATYSWWWMHVTEEYAKGLGKLQVVRDVLHAYTQYPPGAQKVFFTSNHDENSWNGTEYEKYGKAAKAWAVFSCTWQGLSLVYSGQESPNNKRLAFFDKDAINWNDPLQLHGFYKGLLSLRERNAAVKDGETFILPSQNDDQLLAFLRRKGNDVVLVILNVSRQDRISIDVEHEWLNGSFKSLFSGLTFDFAGKVSFELQGGEYIIYEKQ